MRLSDRIRRDKPLGLVVGIILCIGGMVLPFMRITQEKIPSKSELRFINGQLKDYHFNNGFRTNNYTFRIIGFLPRIQIIADFIYLFNDKEFRKLNYGDSITVGLSKKGFERLSNNIDKQIIVYSISKDNKVFLDPDKTIGNYNSPWPIYLSLPIFIWGCYVLYLVYKVYQEQNGTPIILAGERTT